MRRPIVFALEDGCASHIVAPTGERSFGGAAGDYPVLENGNRMIIMQRRLPRDLYDSNAKLAQYIAREINNYTAHLKVGNKQGDAILPIDSVNENLNYVDPDCLPGCDS